MMFVTRFIPAADRDAIVGDVLEEASWRGFDGARRSWWIATQCGSIAVGLAVERARAGCSVALVREVVSGIAIDGGHVWRPSPRTLVVRAMLFAAGVAVLALGSEILIGALLRSAGL